MTRWRDVALIGLLFAALVLFTIYGPARSIPEAEGQRGSAHSSGDEGALALQLWLQTLGYAAGNLESSEWQLPSNAHALLVITPRERPILEREAQEIVRWVRDGGTLIAIDERPGLQLAPNRLWQELGATTTVSDTDTTVEVERATATQPVLQTPPVTSVPVHTSSSVTFADPGYVPLLQTRFGPTLIGRQEGRGYVYLGVSAHPFTNLGLRQPGSAALMLNLLARVPRGGTILFDEYHHGYGQAAAAPAPSLRRLLFSTWWGWASIYAAGVITLYIVLTGRRFGRPVPLRRDIARRSSAEYVRSIAHLLRHGGKRTEIARHYREQVKRRLARQYGIAPGDDDSLFVRDLLYASGASEEQAGTLRSLLEELRRPDLRDADLIAAVRRIDQTFDERGRFR